VVVEEDGLDGEVMENAVAGRSPRQKTEKVIDDVTTREILK
jgi:hypothetical protein